MSIDEAIEQEKFKARVDRIKANKRIFHNNDEDEISACHRSAEEHDQIAEWLEELKFLKQWKSDIMDSFCKYDVSSFEELVTNARNKAIDDFVKEICKMIVQSENNGNYRFYAVEIKQAIADLAEQLKVGGGNEQRI